MRALLQPRFATAYLDVSVRTDRALSQQAMSEAGWTSHGGPSSGIVSERVRAWLAGDLARIEDDLRLQVQGSETEWLVAGDQAWSWPRGPHTVPDDPYVELLVAPAGLADTHLLRRLGTTHAAGREAHWLRAVPRPDARELPWLLEGRDDAELEVDQEHGVLLAVTTRYRGAVVDEVEVVEAVFDEPIDPERFRYEPPPGMLVTPSDEPRGPREAEG